MDPHVSDVGEAEGIRTPAPLTGRNRTGVRVVTVRDIQRHDPLPGRTPLRVLRRRARYLAVTTVELGRLGVARLPSARHRRPRVVRVVTAPLTRDG